MSEHLVASLRDLLAIAWIAGLYSAVRTLWPGRSVSDDLRDTIAIAVAIAFSLAFIGALYSWTCLLAAVLLIFYSQARRPPKKNASIAADEGSNVGYAIAGSTALAVAWPQLVRPVLDGDSLLYHLPNAASWAHAHSIWVASTQYWWFPPASELLATASLLIGGVGSLPLAGLLGSLLIGFRLVSFARAQGFDAWTAGLVSSTFVSMPLAGLQAGSLQNDVWLAAWLVELLWAAAFARNAIARTVALGSLTKPVGFAFIAVAWIALGVPVATLIGFVPFAVWMIRNGLLSSSASIPIVQSMVTAPFQTSIAAHGSEGFRTLLQALRTAGPTTVALAFAIVVGPFAGGKRRYWLLSWVFLGAFLAEPFGFDNGDPQLATGASLRYLMPAFAVALVTVMPFLKKKPIVAGGMACVLTIINMHTIVDIFWNDSNTHLAIVVSGLCFVGLVASLMQRQLIGVALTLCVVSAFASFNVSYDAVRYYDAELSGSHVFEWLNTTRPDRVVVSMLRSGMVDVVLPDSQVEDAAADACAQARHEHAVLLAGDTFSSNAKTFAVRRAGFRRCGRVLYQDPAAIVVLPK